ncbi:Transcription factor bye1, partial [Kappamyces sp. JEL0829]
MLQCDHCHEWFHARCIGLVKEKDPGQDQDQEEEVEVPEVFSCESCNAILAKHEADQQLAESDVGAEKKRKSSPPAVTVVKKAKSELGPSKADKLRRMARKGFEETFAAMFAQSVAQKEPDLDPEIDFSNPGAFAVIVEQALFDAFSSTEGEPTEQYKSKFRSLQFNLKDQSNQRLKKRVCSLGPLHVTPSQLVSLSAEELANDAVLQEAEKIAKESLKLVFKPQIGPGAAATKPKAPAPAEEDFSAVSGRSLDSSSVSPIVSALTAYPAPDESHSSTVSDIASSAQAHDALPPAEEAASSTAAPAPEASFGPPPKAKIAVPPPPQNIESLDDLLAKMDSTTYVAAAADETVMASPETEPDLLPQGEQIWRGLIKMPGEGSFNGFGIQVFGSTIPSHLWKDLTKREFIVTGRIPSSSTKEYIYEKISKKADLAIVELLAQNGKADEKGFQHLVSYFAGKDRYGVIDTKQIKAIKDIYLCP